MILVTANDTSPDPARLRVRTQPGHGKAGCRSDRADGHIIYTPEKGFADKDSFTYDYCEGVVRRSVAAPAACPFATVTVTVTEGPVPVDDPDVVTVEGRHVDIDVMRNDRHPDANRLQVKPRPVPKGTVTVRSDGTVRYIPKTGDTGEDSFQYDYCGSVINLASRGDCPSATVTVDVQPRVPPAIKAITPNPTPPNKEVTVTGTTGSCQEGTLILRIPSPGGRPGGRDRQRRRQLTAALEVPGGTFVRSYTLELRVDCDHQVHTTEDKLEVRNHRPTRSTTGPGPPRASRSRSTSPATTPTLTATTATTPPWSHPAGERQDRGGVGRSGPLHPQRAVHRRRSVHLHLLRHRRCQRQEGGDSATVTVIVGKPPEDPRIDSVQPEASPPNRTVVVKGTTGTCDTAAKLTLNSAPTAATPVPVTGGQDGGFEAKLEIPAGTFVGPYVLKLHAVCSGTEKAVERADSAEQATGRGRRPPPPPASRPTFQCSATTATPTTPTATRPAWPWRRDPAHGTAEAQGDQTIDYTPGREFVDVGEDRFTYRYCDVVGADDRTDCDTATVTVTKKPWRRPTTPASSLSRASPSPSRSRPTTATPASSTSPSCRCGPTRPPRARPGPSPTARSSTDRARLHRRGQLPVRLLRRPRRDQCGPGLPPRHRHRGRRAAAADHERHSQPHAAQPGGGGHGDHRPLPGGGPEAAHPAAGPGRRRGGGDRRPGRQVRGAAEGSWGHLRRDLHAGAPGRLRRA